MAPHFFRDLILPSLCYHLTFQCSFIPSHPISPIAPIYPHFSCSFPLCDTVQILALQGTPVFRDIVVFLSFIYSFPSHRSTSSVPASFSPYHIPFLIQVPFPFPFIRQSSLASHDPFHHTHIYRNRHYLLSVKFSFSVLKGQSVVVLQ